MPPYVVPHQRPSSEDDSIARLRNLSSVQGYRKKKKDISHDEMAQIFYRYFKAKNLIDAHEETQDKMLEELISKNWGMAVVDTLIAMNDPRVSWKVPMLQTMYRPKA